MIFSTHLLGFLLIMTGDRQKQGGHMIARESYVLFSQVFGFTFRFCVTLLFRQWSFLAFLAFFIIILSLSD